MPTNALRRSPSARLALLAACALPLSLLRPALASTYFTETTNSVLYYTFGTGGSTTVFKDTTDTGPFGAGSSAIIPGDNNPDTAIILHANASAGFGAAHLQADAQFVKNVKSYASWDTETYRALSHVIMTLDDVIITGSTPVSTSINLLLDGFATSAATHSDDDSKYSVSGGSSASVQILANNVQVASGFYTVSSTNGENTGPTGYDLFANFTGHNVVSTPVFTLPVNTPVTITFDLAVEASAGMYTLTGGNALTDINFGNTISFATDRPAFNLPDGYTVNSPSANISNNSFTVPEPASLTLLALGTLLLKKRR